jgi:hypothetical protein
VAHRENCSKKDVELFEDIASVAVEVCLAYVDDEVARDEARNKELCIYILCGRGRMCGHVYKQVIHMHSDTCIISIRVHLHMYVFVYFLLALQQLARISAVHVQSHTCVSLRLFQRIRVA